MNKLFLLLLVTMVSLGGCAPEESVQPAGKAQTSIIVKKESSLTKEEQDYVERFNVTIKDIRDFPPKGKNPEKYFYIFKSVKNLADAKILIFGESHVHSANQLWTAGYINSILAQDDVVLFEGGPAGTRIDDVTTFFVTGLFATREYEKLKSHKTWKADAIAKLIVKYQPLFNRTKDFLALSTVNFLKAQGFFWDAVDRNGLNPDYVVRNTSMTTTTESKRTPTNRVIIVTGAGHIPHQQFAENMYKLSTSPLEQGLYRASGASEKQINDDYFDNIPYKTDTRVVFDYLQDKDFAIFIPKNMPGAKHYEAFYPKNAK